METEHRTTAELPNLHTRHWVSLHGHLRFFPGGPSDHVTQLQACRELANGQC